MSYSEQRGSADILVVGAGILGVATSYWLSCLYDCRILLVDGERTVAAHASSRNTGVLHRPFYLNPKTKKVFARSSELSYAIWKDLSQRMSLPWKPVGTLNAATTQADMDTLERYRAWGEENGVPLGDMEVLDGRQAKELEPEVRCVGALLSRADVSVDFGAFTAALRSLAAGNGVSFVGGSEVTSVEDVDGKVEVSFKDGAPFRSVQCRLMINAAGGGALPIAHSRGLATDCSVLNFRGDYWVVKEPFASRVGRNIYTPPRYPQFPFLDPHLVVRADGSRQIGPNAALVAGPYAYTGVGLSSVGRLLSRPLGPKLRLLTNPTFMSMAAKEWYSSMSKGGMCSRVEQFLPGLRAGMLGGHGISGVRSSAVDKDGFVPEAKILTDDRSVHVINYNSPGATGAPSFSAMLVSRLRSEGMLDAFRRKQGLHAMWDFETAADER